MTSDATSIMGKQSHRQNWRMAILALHEMLPYENVHDTKIKVKVVGEPSKMGDIWLSAPLLWETGRLAHSTGSGGGEDNEGRERLASGVPAPRPESVLACDAAMPFSRGLVSATARFPLH